MEKMERGGKGEREGNGDREGVTHFQGQRTCPLARNIWVCVFGDCVCVYELGVCVRVCVSLIGQPNVTIESINLNSLQLPYYLASLKAHNTMMDSKCLLPTEGITFRICKFNGAHEYRIYFKSATSLFPDFNPQQLLNELISTTAAETFI